jgi:hypothetical protein
MQRAVGSQACHHEIPVNDSRYAQDRSGYRRSACCGEGGSAPRTWITDALLDLDSDIARPLAGRSICSQYRIIRNRLRLP